MAGLGCSPRKSTDFDGGEMTRLSRLARLRRRSGSIATVSLAQGRNFRARGNGKGRGTGIAVRRGIVKNASARLSPVHTRPLPIVHQLHGFSDSMASAVVIHRCFTPPDRAVIVNDHVPTGRDLRIEV